MSGRSSSHSNSSLAAAGPELALRLLLLAGLAACEMPTGSAGPPDALPFEAPAVYREWAVEVGSAAHLSSSISRVRWFMVPGDHWSADDGRKKVVGQWFSDGRIYIAAEWLAEEGLIKHEILHELLRGDTGHRHPLFALFREGSY